MATVTYPYGFNPGACPVTPPLFTNDPTGLLLRHFSRPGTVVVFAPSGCGGKAIASVLRDVGVDVVEIAWDAKEDQEKTRELCNRLATDRARRKAGGAYSGRQHVAQMGR